MSNENFSKYKLGWIGCGRMGFPMAQRLAKAGCQISVYNRTKSKAEPLAEYGANVVDSLSELAGCDIVFSMVSTPNDLKQVILGDEGVLSGDGLPKVFVDCSSVSVEVSQEVRDILAEMGSSFIAAPVSGNGKVVKAGKLTIVASGPEEAFRIAEPYLDEVGEGVTYVGEGELARVVKICHNIFLGVVTQNLAEVTVLAEKAGVKRSAFLEFMNSSVMGSVFTRYKTPGWVNLKFDVTFTPRLMRKDMDLGLELGRKHEVPMQTSTITRDVIQSAIGNGYGDDVDFGIVLEHIAKASALEMEPENIDVSDGLA